MFIKQYQKQTKHIRKSKCGKEHSYSRNSTFVVLRCDNCEENFERPRGSMDPKRLSNNFFHVCKNCDAKKFAQKRGVERKKIWDLPANLDIPINKF